jgi:glycosyltransferase involved in cell wall biosynthesis
VIIKQPKVSIIVTCFNLAKYLDEALQSVLDQTYENWECIIVNDGSKDDTEVIAYKWQAKDIRFIYLYQDNRGVSSARNLGIENAKGLYIIPVDADNKLRPNFILQTITILDNKLIVDVVHGDVQLFGNKKSIWKGKPFDISQMVLNNYIDTCACFRKSVWKEVGGYDENMPVYGFEDWDLWLRMAVRGCNFQYEEIVFFDYRVRDNSLLSGAWKVRPLLLNYIFNKSELKHLLPFRNCLIENQKLKEEPSVGYILTQLWKKVRRKFKLANGPN